jgi:phosphotransferase system enzyme I (PtsI)
MLKGVAASPGIAIGMVVVLENESLETARRFINPEEVEAELARLSQAIEQGKVQLEHLQAKVAIEVGADQARIFQAQALILEDYLLLNSIQNSVLQDKLNIELAVDKAIHMFVSVMENSGDDYTRERAHDIRDVGRRIIRNLLGRPAQPHKALTEPAVILAHDLTPSDTVNLDKSKVLGFATEAGGRTSHTAILARTLQIPAVVGVGPGLTQVSPGCPAIIDGNSGLVAVNPSVELVDSYRKRQQEVISLHHQLDSLKDFPAVTLDGYRIRIDVNIGSQDDLNHALVAGAEGIGLFRTEFLFMDRLEMPTEEEQFIAYRKVLIKSNPWKVAIRTLDIGGDKQLAYLHQPQEQNPFLGYRAIRATLGELEVFRQQLRAILRASAFGQVRLVLPMVSTVEEVRTVKALLQDITEELTRLAIAFDDHLEVGIMIEVPSAAILADHLAEEVDFFTIGTNDLTQYTLAVDRMNEKVASLFQPLNPAVLRLIKTVIDASHRAGKWTGLCGEMASDILAVPVLLGLGLDELSMNSRAIPQVKYAIRKLTKHRAEELTEHLLRLPTAEEVQYLLRSELNQLGLESFLGTELLLEV